MTSAPVVAVLRIAPVAPVTVVEATAAVWLADSVSVGVPLTDVPATAALTLALRVA